MGTEETSKPTGTNLVETIFHKNWLKAGLMILLTLLAFSSIFQAGYLWDDEIISLNSNLFQSGAGLLKIWTQPGTIIGDEHFWPMEYTTFWLEAHIWGLHPITLHSVNLLIHLLNAILVWQVLKKLEIPGSWIAGLIFALHPVQVESVAWIFERKGLLSTFFYLMAGWCYLEYSHNRRKSVLLVSMICLGFSLLSKSIGVTFPLALILIMGWKKGKIFKSDWIEMIPFFLVTGLIVGGDYWIHARVNPANLGWGLGERIAHAFYGLSLYFETFFIPLKLMGFYPSLAHSTSHWPIAGTLILMALGGGGLYYWIVKQKRGILTGFLFYCLTLLPVLGFMEFSFLRLSPVADRYQYLACLGLVVLVSAGLGQVTDYLENHQKELKTIGMMLTAGYILTLGSMTLVHAENYKDNEHFFGYCVKENPQSWYARSMLGKSLMEKGEVKEAEYQFTKALEIWPECPDARIFLASLKQKQTQYTEALQLYRSVKTGNPRMLYFAQVQSGWILMALNRPQEAIDTLRKASVYFPNNPDAYIQMGMVYDRLNQFDKANQAYQKALELDWNLALAHNNLGVNLAQSGKLREADKHFDEALRINPQYESARRNSTSVKRALKEL